MGVKNQVIGTAVVSYVFLTSGILLTWPSSVIKVFGSVNTTLDRVMTDTEISFLSGMPSFGALCTIPVSGLLLDKLGRKYTCVLIPLLQAIGWAIMIICKKVEFILAAYFIGGLSSYVYLAVPVYVGEFCQENIRGAMTSGVLSMLPVGWMVSYMMGALDYYIMLYICLSMCVLGTFLMLYMTESPLHLMKKGLEKEAATVIAHYRGCKVTSKEVQLELENIKKSLNPELDDATAETEKLRPEVHEKEKLTTWQFLKKSRSTRRALILSIVMYTATVLQGQVVVMVYAEPLFSKAVPSMSATVSSVIFAVVNILAAVFDAYFVDRMGRRPLMIYSSIITGVFAVVLGSQIQFSWAPNWVTALLIYLFCFTYTTGAGTIPYMMSAEIFLPEIKNFATVTAYEYSFLGFFIVLFLFNPVVSALGLGQVFYIFAAVSMLSALYCAFFMPETKGLTVDAIQLQFYTPRSTVKDIE